MVAATRSTTSALDGLRRGAGRHARLHRLHARPRPSHVRFERDILRAEWLAAESAEPCSTFWIEADAFMRHMVRVLVGTMLEVGEGRRSLEDFEAPARGRAPPRARGETAPPHGLYLASVRY